MEQVILLHQIEQLPDSLKNEVSDFIDFLLSKNELTPGKSKNGKRNGFGCLKGKISISDDFNAPIDDFKEYI
jgi:hypothetical protein